MTMYARVCKECGNRKQVKSSQAAQPDVCADCRLTQRAESKLFLRVCQECFDEKIVRSRLAAAAKHCRECADKLRVPRGPGKANKLRKPRKSRAMAKITREAKRVARDLAINIAHKARLLKEAKAVPPAQTKSDEELIATYLKTNKVTKHESAY